MYRVLIVEDEEIIRKGLVYLTDWIELNCIVVGEADNGADGLELIKTLLPDIVFTDICMPGLDGLEMVNQGRKYCDFCTIILSGYSEFQYARKAIKLRVTDYLLKPIDNNHLKNAVMAAVKQLNLNRKLKKIDEATVLHPVKIIEVPAGCDICDYYVQETINKIITCYNERINLALISNELQVSKRHLSAKFKMETSYTFLEFLSRYRIKKSIELIMEKRWRMSEISEKTGFSDYKHFYNVFSKYVGMSPTQYQESAKG